MKKLIVLFMLLSGSVGAEQYNYRVAFAQGVSVNADSIVVTVTRNDTTIVSMGRLFTVVSCGTGCYDSTYVLSTTGLYQFTGKIYKDGSLQGIAIDFFELGSSALTAQQDADLAAIASGTAVVQANLVSISDDTAASDNLEDMLDGGGSNVGMELQQLKIVNDTGSQTAIYISDGSVESLGGNGSVIYITLQNGTTSAIWVDAVVGDAALYTGATSGMRYEGGTQAGLYIKSTLNAGIELVPGSGQWGIEGELQLVNRTDTVTELDEVIAIPDTIIADLTGIGAAIYNFFTSGVNEQAFWGPGFLPGDSLVVFSVIDSTVSLTARIPFVRIFVFSLADLTAPYAIYQTKSSGYVNGNLPGDSFVVVGAGFNLSGALMLFGWDTLSVDANPDTILLSGAGVAPTSPVAAEITAVHGDIWDLSGNGVKGVVITASLRKLTALDTTNGVVIGPDIMSTTTDSTGYWTIPLTQSSSLVPYQSYYFSAFKRGKSYFESDLSVVVPDTSIWRLTW